MTSRATSLPVLSLFGDRRNGVSPRGRGRPCARQEAPPREPPWGGADHPKPTEEKTWHPAEARQWLEDYGRVEVGIEGLVVKGLATKYEPGVRGWVKHKLRD